MKSFLPPLLLLMFLAACMKEPSRSSPLDPGSPNYVAVSTGSNGSSTLVAPTWSPVGAFYSNSQTVSLSCATTGATLYYTTDGSTPTTNSPRYTWSFTISNSITLKAIAAGSDGAVSAVASETYAIPYWQFVSPQTIPQGPGIYLSFLDFSGKPCFAYTDTNNGWRARVLSYDSAMNSWTPLGTPFATVSAGSRPSLAVDQNSLLHMAFSDGANSGRLSVQSWNGITWSPLGPSGFSTGSAIDIRIAFGGATPFVMYRDAGNGLGLNVKAWDGSAWISLGPTNIAAGSSGHADILVAPSGPVLSYADGSVLNRMTLQYWNGSAWSTIGGTGISPGAVYYTSLGLLWGAPIVAFMDTAAGGRVSVGQWTGSVWSYLGNSGFNPGAASAYDTSMVVHLNTPYVVFRDSGLAHRAVLMKLSGSLWETVGTPGFSPGVASNTILAMVGGVPYVAFLDGASNNQPTVMRYAP